MSEILLTLIFVCIVLIVVEHFNNKVFDINNKLVKLDCTSSNNQSNLWNLIDSLHDKHILK